MSEPKYDTYHVWYPLSSWTQNFDPVDTMFVWCLDIWIMFLLRLAFWQMGSIVRQIE